jgi:hypothetical protein
MRRPSSRLIGKTMHQKATHPTVLKDGKTHRKAAAYSAHPTASVPSSDHQREPRTPCVARHWMDTGCVGAFQSARTPHTRIVDSSPAFSLFTAETPCTSTPASDIPATSQCGQQRNVLHCAHVAGIVANALADTCRSSEPEAREQAHHRSWQERTI